MNNISKLAFVDPDAKLGDNITIDAFAFIDKNVVIGDGCHIRAHTSVLSGTVMGKNNIVYEGAVIGAVPQDFRWDGSDTKCIIGDNNQIREHVIINRSISAGNSTEIGSNSFIMAQTHVGHDSKIGNYCVAGNACKIAGNCRVEDSTILSSAVTLHENSRVGKWCLIKGGCRIGGNVPPFVVMAHNPANYYGVNAYVLRKGKFTDDAVDDIAKCYRHLYQSNTSPLNAIIRITEDVKDSEERRAILAFLKECDNKVVGLPFEEEEY